MHFIATALLSAAISSVSTDSAPRCIILSGNDPYLKKDIETDAVVRTLPGVIADSAGFRPSFTRDTISSDPTEGHLVRVESAIGLGSEGEAAPGEVIAVFIWWYDEGCWFHTHTSRLPADSTAHVTMTLRPRSAWVDGRPTFDVSPFGRAIYRRPFREFLSVEEYAEMVSLIPDRPEWEEDCRPGVSKLYHWVRGHDRTFQAMPRGIVSSCEQTVALKAGALMDRGVPELPQWLLDWSSTSGCEIGPSWSTGRLEAVEGSFLPIPGRQWAVLCRRDDAWRLLILDPDTGEEIVELARLVGSTDDWTVAGLPPEYFYWAPFGDFPGDPNAPPVPRQDALYLSNGGTTVFYHDGVRWVGLYHECCYWDVYDGSVLERWP